MLSLTRVKLAVVVDGGYRLGTIGININLQTADISISMEELYPTGPIAHLIKQISGLQRLKEHKRDWFEELTDREVEILSLIASGMNNPDIARKLNISRATVQNHRARIRDKLDIESQADYIKFGLAFDLIQL